jgi:hypothetical protein
MAIIVPLASIMRYIYIACKVTLFFKVLWQQKATIKFGQIH